MRQMLQSLLADRFKMQIHRETREVPVYSLTVAKGGPKLRRSDQPEDDSLAYGRRTAPVARRRPVGRQLHPRIHGRFRLGALAHGTDRHRQVVDKPGWKGITISRSPSIAIPSLLPERTLRRVWDPIFSPRCKNNSA